MEKSQFNTPVLFLIFNRPATTIKVLEAIRLAKPSQLFISSDGPRETKQGEKALVEGLRKDVLNLIDWPCEVKTLFRSENLGCKYAVSGAIDWFFENVEQGIILEDDCVPDPSFFRFCEELLEKYKDTSNVMSICGYNVFDTTKASSSYIFSDYFRSWGWATWKNSWNQIDLSLSKYKKVIAEKNLSTYYPNRLQRLIMQKKISLSEEVNNNSWAIPWVVSHHLNYFLTIIPTVNLVENIGFDNNFSTHTKENRWDKIFFAHKKKSISFPLVHPLSVNNSMSFNNGFLRRETLRFVLKKIF